MEKIQIGKPEKTLYKGNETFSVIEIYMLEMYSSRAFKRYVTWYRKLPIAEVTDQYFLEEKRLKRQYLVN